MRYMITGGAGFIGSHLLRSLLAAPSTKAIYVLDLQPPAITDSRLEYVPWDIRNPYLPEIARRSNVCVHLAALCKEPGYGWDDYFITNHHGTRLICNMLDTLEIRNLIFTSTMMVFRAGEQQMSEDCITAPDTAYGVSKLLAEAEINLWASHGEGRRFRIVRPGVVFGRGENGNFARLYRALKSRRFAYVGRKQTIKGCIYVKDVVSCIQFLMSDTTSRSIYNLVLPQSTTIEMICEAMIGTLHLRPYRIPTIPFGLALGLGYLGEIAAGFGIPNDLHHRRAEKLYRSTHLSVRALLEAGFTPAYDLAAGLADWMAECVPGEPC